MNKNTLIEEFKTLYFDIETILPDKVLELVYRYYYPHSLSGQSVEPITQEALNAVKEIHQKYIAAVASVVGCSSEEMMKQLENIHKEHDDECDKS